MSAGWVAGSVRARAMTHRRLGTAGTRQVATSATAADALRVLAGSPYGHDVLVGQSLADAEHALGQTVLWNLRVLAGWLPRAGGAGQLRLLAGWFELANIDDLVHRLDGARSIPAPYRLGALATAWPRLASAATRDELRAGLAASPWGDPGDSTPWALHVGPRLAWAERVVARVPEAAGWAVGAVALLVAREIVLAGRRPTPMIAHRVAGVLGVGATDAVSVPALSAGLPARGRWVLDGVDHPVDLWRAEARWWQRVERDGFALLRRSRWDAGAAVGVAAVLAADAWRARAALQAAARGDQAAFDALG